MRTRSCGDFIEPLEDRQLLAHTLPLGPNINASRHYGSQAEVSIAINPRNTQNVVAATMDSNPAGLLVMRSFDGGYSWSRTRLGNKLDHMGNGIPRYDPHVTFDAYGNLFIAYIAGVNNQRGAVMLARSKNGGKNIGVIPVLNSPSFSADFPSIASGTDPRNARQALWISFSNGNDGQVYAVAADSYGLGRLTGFTRPVQVSGHDGGLSSVAVSPNGRVVVAWESPEDSVGPAKIYTATASRPGAQFGSDRFAASTPVGGDYPIPAQPDRGITGAPTIAFDTSGGSTNGRLYLVYTTAPGQGDPNTNVGFQYSDNNGKSWSSPIQVNDDSGRSHFFPSLAVDQTTGFIGVSWYDARNSQSNTVVQVYAAFSATHGQSFWGNVQISDGMSSAYSGGKGEFDLGDYGGAAYMGGIFIPAWADNSNSTGDNPNGTSGFNIYVSPVLAS